MKPLSTFLLAFLVSHQIHAQDAIENFLGMRFVSISAGEFVMGTDDLSSAIMEIPEPEPGALAEESPAHRVVISKAFYIAETEVTQEQWFRVMENKPGPDVVWNRKDWKSLPVTAVSWFMAQRFIEEINKMDHRYRYRLPTEAEWEYVAKDGVNELRPVAIDDLEEHAWFITNSGDVPHAVATRTPNRFGVYDMLGNVWEWVDDWYAPETYTKEKRIDPAGPANGRSKVRRGGSYHCPLHLTRPGYRSANLPGTRYEVLGFRVVAHPRQ
jgi:formylglycine-generating enzyme required for sulfatase activity